MEEKSKVGKVVSVMIMLLLIVAVVILFYQNTQNKAEVETKLNELENEMDQIREEENALKNELANNDTMEEDNQNIIGEENQEANQTEGNAGQSGTLKKFTFSTPVGESGIFEVNAEKAIQATGFSGASAHIFYLKEGNLYYHNEGSKDTQLASGITDLKQQGEDIIAVKGKDAKIITSNAYIQYQ